MHGRFPGSTLPAAFALGRGSDSTTAMVRPGNLRRFDTLSPVVEVSRSWKVPCLLYPAMFLMPETRGRKASQDRGARHPLQSGSLPPVFFFFAFRLSFACARRRMR